jgi:hypothetical protein
MEEVDMTEGHPLRVSWVARSRRDSLGGKAKELEEDRVDKVRDSFFMFLDRDLGGGGNWKDPESEVDGETAEVEVELCLGARVMVSFGGGESTRSPEGGSMLRGAGGVVEEGSMVHALRDLMLLSEDSFCFGIAQR